MGLKSNDYKKYILIIIIFCINFTIDFGNVYKGQFNWFTNLNNKLNNRWYYL